MLVCGAGAARALAWPQIVAFGESADAASLVHSGRVGLVHLGVACCRERDATTTNEMGAARAGFFPGVFARRRC
jgi:hypothetical protein